MRTSRRLLCVVAAMALAVPMTGAASGPKEDGGGGPERKKMRLVGQHDLNGSGNLGEGYTEIETADGRRILYAAHESGPRCFSVLDVTDPAAPRLLRQVDVPDQNTRCNSLDRSGDVLAVANQIDDPEADGGTAGVQTYDVGDPTAPEHIGFYDTSGPHSRGVHFVWFADGRYLHMSSGMPDFEPRRPGKDDQIYVSLDMANPREPEEVGRWWWPGTRVGDEEPLPEPNEGVDTGCRAHNTDVFPDTPNRVYIGYIDCGMAVLDISDKARPKPVALLDESPPTPGFTHTLQPIRGGDYIVSTQEAVQDNCTDGDKRGYVYGNEPDSELRHVSTLPEPRNADELCERGGRYGAHNVFERTPDEPTWWSDDVVVGGFFNAGVRAYDVSDPKHPREVAYYVPEAPEGSPAGAIQINDAYVDDRGVIFAGDRYTGGLYVLRSPVTR